MTQSGPLTFVAARNSRPTSLDARGNDGTADLVHGRPVRRVLSHGAQVEVKRADTCVVVAPMQYKKSIRDGPVDSFPNNTRQGRSVPPTRGERATPVRCQNATRASGRNTRVAKGVQIRTGLPVSDLSTAGVTMLLNPRVVRKAVSPRVVFLAAPFHGTSLVRHLADLLPRDHRTTRRTVDSGPVVVPLAEALSDSTPVTGVNRAQVTTAAGCFPDKSEYSTSAPELLVVPATTALGADLAIAPVNAAQLQVPVPDSGREGS